MNPEIQAQKWLDTNLYPFEHQYLQLPSGKMHYVDEGKGDVILFVHGTPTWSFLYRDFVKELSKTHRCIAMDHIGFGLSDKPEDFAGSPQAHAENLNEFIRKLNLQNITLVVHDFGGPIGLAAATEQPERFKQIVSFNTWLWETASNPEAQKVDKIINSFIGRFLYLNLNFSPRVLLKKGFVNKSKLPKEIHWHYIKPFPDKASRNGLLKIAQSLVGASDWYENQWRQLHKIENLPWLIIWGTQDEFINQNYLAKWKKRLPQAKVVELDCGHFVQEEKTEEVLEVMECILAGNTVSEK